MKKMIYFALTTLLLTGCGQGKEGVGQQQVPASSVAETTTMVPKTEVTQATPRADYVSNDLLLFDLRGPVKTLRVTGEKYTCFDEGVYTFSREGRFEKYKCESPKEWSTDYNQVHRSQWGTIVGFGNDEQRGRMVLEYDKPGDHIRFIGYKYYLVEEALISFTYDARGDLVKEVDDQACMADEITTTVTYTARDSHGNWTHRQVEHRSDEGTRRGTTSREITYYQ